MRIHILFASAAALVACGGSTAPVSATAPDAASDVAIDHGGQVVPVNTAPTAHESVRSPARTASVSRPGSTPSFSVDAGSGGSSSGGGVVDSGAGSDASTTSFACGSVMCTGEGQYCAVSKAPFGSNTTYNCMEAPFGCSSGVTCACVNTQQNPFDSGTNCTCATDGNGHVTLTCPY